MIPPAAGAGYPPAAGGYPPAGYPPGYPPSAGGPGYGGYDPYGEGPRRSIKGWVIGGVVLAALIGLVGGAIWASTSGKLPTPTPSGSQSSSPSPSRSSSSAAPTRTSSKPTPPPTQTSSSASKSSSATDNPPQAAPENEIASPTLTGPPLNEARPD